MRMKKMLIVILFAICLVGCGNKKEIETTLNDSAELHSENVSLNEQEVTDAYETVKEEEIVEEQEDIALQDDMFEEDDEENEQQDVIQEYSQIQIKNFLQDGTFWGIETNVTGEVYTIHADVFGNILKRVSASSMENEIRYGIGDSFVIWNREYPCRIYDLDTDRDATADFIGDYDELYDLLETEDGLIFVARKTIDTFEEKYECVKLIDADGNALIEISLDKETLLAEYGLEKDYQEKPKVKWIGKKVFYMPYVGDSYADRDYDSLIIDFARNKVIPVDAPNNNMTGYCYSDGNYTVIYESYSSPIIVNHETGEVVVLEGEYIPASGVVIDQRAKGVSEGKFLATTYKDFYVLDIQGNMIIDLNNYGPNVTKMYPFAEGAALIEFENGYVTFIGDNGEFLFEPVKGTAANFYRDLCAAVIVDYDAGEVFLLDREGDKERLYISNPGNIFCTEYEGRMYLVEGEAWGLKTMLVQQ